MENISKIGLGCVTFGREIDQEASFEIMDHALAKGVNFFDTAAGYGGGSSEMIIGKWLASRRPASGNITVATKILPPFSPQKILASVHESLKRLGTPAIDLLYLHSWDQSVEKMENLAALDTLVSKGDVRMLGASNFNTKQLRQTLDQQKNNGLATFRFIQNNHNLAISELNNDAFRICQENGIAVVSYSPLGAGFLTGKYNRGIPEGTRFDLIPGHQNIYFTKQAHRRLGKLKIVAGRTGYAMITLALAWALHQPGISSVLVGGRTPKHLDQAFEALKCCDENLFAELQAP